MGAVTEQFERELRQAAQQHAGNPQAELVCLALVALEREEVVSVAYREHLISRRLRELALPEPVRELVHAALLWTWKDEEMHAIYVRGLLFLLGGPWLRAQALAQQSAGALGGWAASVSQHARFRSAPLSCLLARLVLLAGQLAGRVPASVRRHLAYGTFRDFCRYNVDAERTAALCWQRLAELAPLVPRAPHTLAGEAARVALEEAAHERVFAILAGALDEHDRLLPSVTAESLAAQLGAVSEFFLPRALRPLRGNPLGSGGVVAVVEGEPAADKHRGLRSALDQAGFGAVLAARARALGRPLSSLRVAIKPTFMLGYHHKDRSLVTDPELLAEFVRVLREAGVSDVCVIEGRNIYDRFFAHRSVAEVAHYFGYAGDYQVADADLEQVDHAYFRGMGQYSVARSWRDADLRISFAKLRSHPVEHVYLSLPNVEWIGARCDSFLFPERMAQRETAILMLLDEFPPHFALVEGWDGAADGLVGVMGCPHPRTPRRIYAGADALAVDVVAARHLGVGDVAASVILRTARQWFGDPGPHTQVVGVDTPVQPWRGPYADEWSALLSFLSIYVYTFGSGRGALFVPEMDAAAFPALGEGRLLRCARGVVRALIGLRHPA